MKFNKLAIALAVAGMSTGAYATNGMDMEGYGPISTGMGGASMAFDNGTAAMANNPATLGLMGDGSRLDLAVGVLGPDVHSSTSGDSSGNSYLMPAIGWAKKNGTLSYGVGVFAQGGMGTKYAMGLDGMPEKSQLGVGRLIFPLSFQVNPNLNIGGSLDYVWATLDLRMAMPLSSMAGLITQPGNGTLGTALNNLGMGGYNTARLDFDTANDFTGAAKATGYAGKIGFTYKASPMITIGGVYQSKTSLSDMTGGALLIATQSGANAQTVVGKISVRDFQWPETYGLGLSVQATPDLMVAADWKHIGWASVMKNFTMTYSALGDNVTFALPQNWKDQNVFNLGVAYKATGALTLRAGANIADNPVPDATMNYLFPAIIENNYTAGFGYAFNAVSDVNFSYAYAPKVTQTNSTFGYTVSHSQSNWQLMYSHRF